MTWNGHHLSLSLQFVCCPEKAISTSWNSKGGSMCLLGNSTWSSSFVHGALLGCLKCTKANHHLWVGSLKYQKHNFNIIFIIHPSSFTFSFSKQHKLRGILFVVQSLGIATLISHLSNFQSSLLRQLLWNYWYLNRSMRELVETGN